MNQRGFAKIVLIVVIVILAGVGTYFALVKKAEPVKPILSQNKFLTYSNEELHIAFQYPDNFKVYNANKDELRVESDYKKEGALGASIGMNITRINTAPESITDLDKRLELKYSSQGRQIQKEVENHGNYQIVKYSGGEIYLVSQKDTFYIGNSLNLYKASLSQEQFTDYRKKFDAIMGSIIIK